MFILINIYTGIFVIWNYQNTIKKGMISKFTAS